TINVGTGGFLTFAAYIITLPIVGQTNALIISEAVKEAGSLFGTSIKNSGADRSIFWTNQSNKIINRAVELTNDHIKNQGKGIIRFIPVAHKFNNNSAFTNNSYLWGMENGNCQKDGLVFPPEDSVKKERRAICEDLHKTPGDLFFCLRYSFFHPNIKGVDNVYVPEILNSLTYSGFMGKANVR
ncbi:MAG: hypothetical protein H7263_04100, partial [Candidatus Sericytochromatia bacterium]|nr:hypothetical protein [Candidatus Sericytochromatia bacterium]